MKEAAMMKIHKDKSPKNKDEEHLKLLPEGAAAKVLAEKVLAEKVEPEPEMHHELPDSLRSKFEAVIGNSSKMQKEFLPESEVARFKLYSSKVSAELELFKGKKKSSAECVKFYTEKLKARDEVLKAEKEKLLQLLKSSEDLLFK